MNKDKLAHEYAIARLSSGAGFMTSEIVEDSWRYADLMQVEADKRRALKQAEMRELLEAPNTFVEKEGMHFDDVNFEVDWDQAPVSSEYLIEYWCVDKDGQAWWFSEKPQTNKTSGEWHSKGEIGFALDAPNFSYTGDWRNSLRVRPEAERHG